MSRSAESSEVPDDLETAGPDRNGGRGDGGLFAWLDGRRLSSEERKECLEALSLGAEQSWWQRFFIVMTVAVVIATVGLLLDSAAVVIGAMLIAPLMTPVLALSASIAMGWPRKALRQFAGLVTATLGAVGIAWIIGSLVPRNELTNEVLSRTSPDLRDLVVALAAGFGGAYMTVRRNMAGSLPGVAVAVALVPPLGAVGLALSAGQVDLAEGAALLYGANLAAIVLSGLVVFLSTGFVPAQRLSLSWERVSIGAVITLVVVAAIAVPLARQSAKAVASAQRAQQVNVLVSAWLSESPDRLSSVDVDDKTVTVDVVGPVEPPPVDELRPALADAVGEGLSLQVRWTQQSNPAEGQVESEDVEEPGAQEKPDPPNADELAPLIDDWLSSSDASPDSFEVTGVEVGDDGKVLVVLRSAEAPPASDQLAAIIEERFGTSFGVTIEWSDTSANNPAPEDDLASQVRALARAWAQDQGGDLSVENVEVENGVAYIDLAGSEPPANAATLARDIESAIQDAPELEVRFSLRSRIPTETTSTTTTTSSQTTTAPSTTSSSATTTTAGTTGAGG